jgi:glycosyltransferase involved in cell wall biosynthesis
VPNILIFTSGGCFYGAEKGLLNAVKVLINASKFSRATAGNFNITVVLPKSGILEDKLKALGVKVQIFPLAVFEFSFSPLYYLKYFFLFLADLIYFSWFILFYQFDIIYTNSILLFFPACLAKILGKKHLWHIREFFPSAGVNKFIAGTVKFFSSRIICQSQNIENVLFGKNSYRGQVIYEGVDTADYVFTGRDKKRQELGILSDAVMIVFISRLHPAKGQYEFLQKIPEIIKEINRRVIFIFAGDISSNNYRQVKYKQQLSNYIASNKLTSLVRIIGFCPDIASLLEAGDIFVFPVLRNEPFGIALQETLVFAESVFISDNPGFNEINAYFDQKAEIFSINNLRRTIAEYKFTPRRISVPEIFSFNYYQRELLNIISNL